MNRILQIITLPIAGTALYLTYLHTNLSRKVQCITTPFIQNKSITIPDTVWNNPSDYIIHHECARKIIPTMSLGTAPDEAMLTRYLRHTMADFARRPPAWGLWYLIKDAKDRATFDTAYIRSLQFVPGDRVCGTYVVTSRAGGRITLSLSAPESYAGPLVEGMLIAEIKEEGGQTTFTNHTVMWREQGKGSAGVLEGTVGRWMHGLMVRSLVEGAVRQLVSMKTEKKAP
ncbi:hypothetical protein IQ06DRAFT_296558 [Phaeosphaeriaceae sp. SRC1lsM3a]|nr:hypothetical protein IQ06DRAFT_296558 [Stagonospora sp. SRC1lsM3a]